MNESANAAAARFALIMACRAVIESVARRVARKASPAHDLIHVLVGCPEDKSPLKFQLGRAAPAAPPSSLRAILRAAPRHRRFRLIPSPIDPPIERAFSLDEIFLQIRGIKF